MSQSALPSADVAFDVLQNVSEEKEANLFILVLILPRSGSHRALLISEKKLNKTCRMLLLSVK